MLWTQSRSKAKVWDVTLTAIDQSKKSLEHTLGLVGSKAHFLTIFLFQVVGC